MAQNRMPATAKVSGDGVKPAQTKQQASFTDAAIKEGANERITNSPGFATPKDAPVVPKDFDGPMKEKHEEPNLWDAKIEAMRVAGTMPADIYQRRAMKSKIRSEVARKHVKLDWLHKDSWENKDPIGVPWDLYSPVTEREIKEFDIEIESTKRSSSGAVLGPTDSILAWIPIELADKWRDLQGRRAQKRKIAAEAEAASGAEGAFGAGVRQASQQEVAAMAAQEAKGFGKMNVKLDLPEDD